MHRPGDAAREAGGSEQWHERSRRCHTLLTCRHGGLYGFWPDRIGGYFCANRLGRWVPRAALLSTLAGIAVGCIALGVLLRTDAHSLGVPASLAVILLGY